MLRRRAVTSRGFLACCGRSVDRMQAGLEEIDFLSSCDLKFKVREEIRAVRRVNSR